MIFFAVVVSILLFLVLIGVVYQQAGMRRDAELFPPTGRLVDIGNGRKLHIHVTGEGAPTVVLEAGIGASSLSWQLVQPEIARFTTVCSYDRAGLGFSDQACTPRTPSAIARELRALLACSRLPAPYLLVGHSFGGLVAQQFAALFPKEVCGVVLADPLSPGEWLNPHGRRRRMLWGGAHLSRRGAMLARVGVVRACLNAVMRGGKTAPKIAGLLASGRAGSGLMSRLAGEIRKLPKESWPVVAAHWSNPKCFEGMARHIERLPETSSEMSAVRPLDVPAKVIVAEHVARAGLDPAPALPQAIRVVALGSGHWVQLDSPELVIGAVRELVDHWRSNREEPVEE